MRLPSRRVRGRGDRGTHRLRVRLPSLFCGALLLILPFLTFLSAAAAPFPDNLYDFTRSYCGIVGEDGREYFDHRCHTSAALSVVPGDELTFGPLREDQALYLCAFDGGGRLLYRITSGADQKLKLRRDGDLLIASYTVPSGAAAVRLTCSAEYYDLFLVTRNGEWGAAEYRAFLDRAGLTGRFDRVSAYGSFAGKRLLWCGDSVGVGLYEHYYPGTEGTSCTKANKDNGTHPAWAGRVAYLLGMKTVNVSRGGASISTKRANIPNLFTQVKENASSAYDYIIIEGGSVDAGGSNGIKAPLGFLSSYDLSSFDSESTFIGGLERCFYYASEQAPGARIVFVIAYSMPKHPNNSNAWEEYWQYVLPVCEKWGADCVDLYRSAYVNGILDLDRTPNGSDAQAFYYDALHVSPMGYSVTASEIAYTLAGLGSRPERHMPDQIPEALLPRSVKNADAEASPVLFDGLGNYHDPELDYPGRMDSDGSLIPDEKRYYTTACVTVSPGDVLRFGPSNPSQGYHLIGFGKTGGGVTGWVKAASLTKEDTLADGRVIYSYTVPTGVYRIRLTFPLGTDAFVTVNENWDKELLARRAAALTEAATTVGDPLTAASPTVTGPDTATPDGPDTESASAPSGGCGALIPAGILGPILVCALPQKQRKNSRRMHNNKYDKSNE